MSGLFLQLPHRQSTGDLHTSNVFLPQLKIQKCVKKKRNLDPTQLWAFAFMSWKYWCRDPAVVPRTQSLVGFPSLPTQFVVGHTMTALLAHTQPPTHTYRKGHLKLMRVHIVTFSNMGTWACPEVRRSQCVTLTEFQNQIQSSGFKLQSANSWHICSLLVQFWNEIIG